jgi:hypothetical protein
MNPDRLLVALLFVLLPCLVLEWNEGPTPAFADILARVRHECDPTNPEADYSWNLRTMPTERKREAILADARKIGARLLPEVRGELAREKDAEVQGMLTVMAAALGDEAAIEQAGREMAWSGYPAVRICAARTLRRLKDRRTVEWFLAALQDDHFVVNGGCGTLREKFCPVRVLAELALQEVVATGALSKAEVLRIEYGLQGGRYESELRRKLEELELEVRRRGRR